MFDFNPIYLFYALIGLSAMMFAEGIYLFCYNTGSYRKNINRRLRVLDAKPDRESALIQLRRERGLTAQGEYYFQFANLNRLLLHSGLTIGIKNLILGMIVITVATFAVMVALKFSMLQALGGALFGGVATPVLVLKILRNRRQKAFGAQFPDAMDIIVRSLRAGHPVPVAIGMVAREMPDPIGSEFGIVGDEITYGAELESAMRGLYYRVGTDDLPLFVTAVVIQTSTGGNLGEILKNLSGVVRLRFKMRRKIRALAAEGRASALILSSLPILMFAVIQFMVPTFYANVWNESITKIILALAACWMGIGNFIMYRLVNFKI